MTLHISRRGAFAVSSLAVLSLAISAPCVRAQEFATTVVSSSGLGSNSFYNNPNAILGQPATLTNGIFDSPSGTYHNSIVYPPYATDPSGNNLIVTLGTSGEVTVTLGAPIVHSANNYYGDDFIVFGNTFFPATSGVTPTANMANVDIGSSGGIYQNGTPVVSVSEDGTTWTTLTPQSPWWPTDPFQWVGISASNPSGWSTTTNDFSLPVNPDLTQADFGGVSVADASNNLYDGSAGGAAFTLAGTGLTQIQYIRVSGGGNSSVVDAISRVGSDIPATPEPGGWEVIGVGLAGLLLAVRRGRIKGRRA